nr:helix-turn-helix transcriptional regulator [Eubacterium sp. 1001713B170207_170306_E7]
MDAAFGRWLRESRRARGLTQQGLADAAGLSHKTVFRAERGQPVSAYSRAQLTAFLGEPPPAPADQSDQSGHFTLSIYREHL